MGLLNLLFFGRKANSAIKSEDSKKCICEGSFQSIGCPAYDDKSCIWHPDNDPYGLKDREWVDGFFVKKKKPE